MTERLLAAFIASSAFATGLAALGWGAADLAAVQGRVAMDEWSRQGYVGSSEEWGSAYRRLRIARRLAWLSADHSADLGRVLEWQAWQQPPGSSEQHAYRVLAGRLYREALTKRPGWGLAWAHFAENRLLRGHPDDQFAFALERAMTLAPWEPGVQLKVAWMGMATWEELPGETRSKVLGSIARTLDVEEHTHAMVRLAFQYGWLEHLVPMLRTDRQRAVYEFVRAQAAHRRAPSAAR